MSESKFSKRMRDKLVEFQFEFFRVESHATCPGIGDIHWLFIGGAATGWIETKQSSKMPKKVAYETNQAPWLQSYARRGGNSCTLIHVAEEDVVIYVPGRESVAAEKDLSRCLGARRVALAEEGAWRRVAKLILGSNNA